MDDEIYLSDIFRVLWKSRLMIIGIFAIFVLVAGVMSFAVMSPSYRSSTIVALGNFGDPIYTNQDSATTIILSDEYLLDVIEQLDFEVPPEEFRGFKIASALIKALPTFSLYQQNEGAGKKGWRSSRP